MRENYLLTEDACPVIHTENDAELFELLFSHLIYEAESKLYFYDEISSNIVKILLAHIRRMLAYGNESYFKTNESYKQAKEFIDKKKAEKAEKKAAEEETPETEETAVEDAE